MPVVFVDMGALLVLCTHVADEVELGLKVVLNIIEALSVLEVALENARLSFRSKQLSISKTIEFAS